MLYILGYTEIYTSSVSSHRHKNHIPFKRRKAKGSPGLYKEVEIGILLDRDKTGKSTLVTTSENTTLRSEKC